MKLIEYIICSILMYVGCYSVVLLTGADNNTLCIGFTIVMVGSIVLSKLTQIVKLLENRNND